jgi:hypothetical protein
MTESDMERLKAKVFEVMRAPLAKKFPEYFPEKSEKGA